MRFLTATDKLQIRTTEIDKWSHHLICPWCGEDAWIVGECFQCLSGVCSVQAASTEDLLALHAGSYAAAARFLASHYKLEKADLAAAARRKRERRVMDTWVSMCQAPPTSEAVSLMSRMQSRGFGIRHSRFNAVILDSRQTAALVTLAKETGADYPDNWDKQPPPAGRAFCIQSQPHTIDRILLMNNRGSVHEIVWNRYAAGFCSLIGLRPDKRRLMVADIETAQRLQHSRAAGGLREEIASVYTDLFGGDVCPRWDIPLKLLTAVPRHCAPQQNPEHTNSEDIITIQQALDQFPGLEELVSGMPYDWAVDLQTQQEAFSFADLRFAMIAAMIPSRVTQVPPACASILERTGTRPEDIVNLVKFCGHRDRRQLTEDIELLALTRVIFRSEKMKVKETATDYRVVQGALTVALANFSLRISSSVTFPNQNGDRYCQATLRCGDAAVEVLFPQSMLSDKIGGLENELQRQLSVAGYDRAGNPTVIEVNKFRTYVVPHLRTQAAKAAPIRGVDLLGWSEDRRSFTFPGFVLTRQGIRNTSSILCPAVPVLSRFEAVQLSRWAESCPSDLDLACRDLVAILVASCVRYYRRCITKPIMVAQSSAAMTALDKISAAFGQREIFSLNQNIRKGGQVEGIHGYPFLAAGPRQASLEDYQTPYIHLTDQGYKMPTTPTTGQAAAAGRAAQFCLKSVSEWCLATGGDAFNEVASVAHHRSLLREGRWLIENVCGVKSWEVSEDAPTAIEKLLEQIPYAEVGHRLTLIDGQELMIDLGGLKHDHDGILREAREMGTVAAIENGKVISPAVRMLPAIAAYYGQEPDVTVIAT